MFQSAAKNDNLTTESLSQLRVTICSVRLPASTKLIDISVLMEVDNKYTYRTEVIRKKGKINSSTNPPLVTINESFDILVTSNSKIMLKILSPTRLFGNHDIGQLDFDIKTIIHDYISSEQTNNEDTIPSYVVKLPFDNLTRSSSIFRSNNTSNSSNGIIEITFHGNLLKKQAENITRLVNIFSFSNFQSVNLVFYYRIHSNNKHIYQ